MDKDGHTPLIWACLRGSMEIVGYLLNHQRVKVNIQSNDDRTALFYACIMGHLEVVRALINDPRVQVNMKDKDDFTALTWASHYGYSEVVRALLEDKRVDVDIRNKFGKTALDVARDREYDDVARLLENYTRTERMMSREEEVRNRQKKLKLDMENTRQRLTGDPRRRTDYCPSDIEEDRNKLLDVMRTPSAEPVELSMDYIERCIKKDHDGKPIKLDGCIWRCFLGGR
ncbi:hypothetical protein MHU86_22810 [Fragilaria crotonensis]|nr:hypothetical protein MHU86_22810 [Fragilaria crotonensis]